MRTDYWTQQWEGHWSPRKARFSANASRPAARDVGERGEGWSDILGQAAGKRMTAGLPKAVTGPHRGVQYGRNNTGSRSSNRAVGPGSTHPGSHVSLGIVASSEKQGRFQRANQNNMCEAHLAQGRYAWAPRNWEPSHACEP